MRKLYGDFTSERENPMQVANDFMTFLYTLDNGQATLANVLLFGLGGLRDIVINLITFQWVGWLIHLPQIRPAITDTLIRENLFIGPEGWKDGAFSVFAIMQDSPTTLGLNKFGVGILNSIFLMLPVSTASVLAIRRLTMEGVNAWVAATLGTVVGEISFIACVLFGGQAIITRWHFFGPFSYLAGFLLTLNVLFRMGLIIREVPVRKILRDAFLVNFALSWLEQGTILQKLQYFSWSAEQTNLMQRFNSSNPQEDLIIHLSYLVGLTVGCLTITAMVGYWLLYVIQIPWEQDQTGGALGLGVKGKLGIGRRGIGIKTKYRDLWSFRLVLIMASLALPYHGADYLSSSVLGFSPRDLLVENSPISDLKNDGENVFDLFFHDEGNWTESNNFVEEFRWRKTERDILKQARAKVEARRTQLPDRITEATKFPEIDEQKEWVNRTNPRPREEGDDSPQGFVMRELSAGAEAYEMSRIEPMVVLRSVVPVDKPINPDEVPTRRGFLGTSKGDIAERFKKITSRDRELFEKSQARRNGNGDNLIGVPEPHTLRIKNRYRNEKLALPITDDPFSIKDRKDWLEYKAQLDTGRMAPFNTSDIVGAISKRDSVQNEMLLPPTDLKDFALAEKYNQRLFRTIDAPEEWKENPLNGEVFVVPKFFKRPGDFIERPYNLFKVGLIPERAFLESKIDPPMFDRRSKGNFKLALGKGKFWPNKKLISDITERIQANPMMSDADKNEAIAIGPLWATAGRPMKQLLFTVARYGNISPRFETQNTFYSFFGYKGLTHVNRMNKYPPIMAIMRNMADRILASQPKSQFVTDEQKRRLQYHKAALARYNRSLRRYRESVNHHVIQRLGNAKSKSSYVYRQQFKGRYRVVRRLFFADAKRWNNPYNEPIFEYAQLLPADPTVSFRHEELEPVDPGADEHFMDANRNFPWYFAWDEEARKTVLTTGTVNPRKRPRQHFFEDNPAEADKLIDDPSLEVYTSTFPGDQDPSSIGSYKLPVPTKMLETPWKAKWDPSFYARKTDQFITPDPDSKSLWTKFIDQLFGPRNDTLVNLSHKGPFILVTEQEVDAEDLSISSLPEADPKHRMLNYRRPLLTRSPKG